MGGRVWGVDVTAVDLLTTRIYDTTALDYLAGGWSPLPLPPREKHDPPAGFTGYRGDDADEAQVRRWSAEHPADANIALRVPPDVIGVDVDLYKGDTALNLEHLQQRFGPLPATVMSTSRTDGSGIRLYRVPVGTMLRGAPAGGIEIVQAHHRYLVAPPSIHPEGRPYRWIDEASGEILDRPPDPSDLPDLPWAWIEGLQVAGGTPAEVATPAQAADFFKRITASRSPGMAKGLRTKLDQRHTDGKARHDTLLEVACWGMREAAAGAYPATEVEQICWDWWCEVIEDPRRRDGGEFASAMSWAVAQADADVARVTEIRKAIDQRHTIPAELMPPDRPAKLDLLSSPTSDPAPAGEDQAGSTWKAIDLEAVLAGDMERTVPVILRRHDGRALIYTGRINGFHADSGIGKSLLALFAAIEVMATGGHVAWIDFEDPGPGTVIERLQTAGVTNEVIAAQFHYFNPDEPATPAAVRTLSGELDHYGSCLAIVDSVGESLGLHGLNEDKDLEVDTWKRLLAHPLERAGHTVVLIDHATKAADNPLHPSGSKRKRALISGASWLVEQVTAFDREHPGKLKLTCAKDRHGNYRRGETGAWIHIDPTGAHLQVLVEAPSETSTTAADPAGVALLPTVLRVLKDAGADGLGIRAIRPKMRVIGKAANQAIDDALELGAAQGLIAPPSNDIPNGKPKPYRWLRDLTEQDREEILR
jgi:hypothetical protein